MAQLTGEAKHHASWRDLTGDEETVAVAALRELGGGRAGLLAEVAGVLEGASEGELDEPLARQAAGLCRAAGADPDAIPGWVAEGRRRRVAARIPPTGCSAKWTRWRGWWFVPYRHRVPVGFDLIVGDGLDEMDALWPLEVLRSVQAARADFSSRQIRTSPGRSGRKVPLQDS